MTNEIKVANDEKETPKPNELLVAKSNDRYEIIQDEEGKYKRKAKYESFCSIVPQNRQEKISLLNLLEGSDEATNGLKDHKGKQFEVANVIFRPYDRINEETGEQEYGVLTYLLTPDGVPYVTSSKSVYFTMKRIFEVFGEPNTDQWENIIVKVVEKKGLQHKFIDVKMVG